MTADAQKTVVLTINLDYSQLQSLITLLEDNPDIVNPLKKACAEFERGEARSSDAPVSIELHANCNPAELSWLGSFLVHHGIFESALIAYQAALKLTPNNPLHHLQAGDCFAGLGQTDKALEHFRLALDFSHDSGEEIRLMMRSRILGKIFLLTGNTLDGIETLQAAFDRATQEGFPFVAKDCSRWIERAHSSPAPL